MENKKLFYDYIESRAQSGYGAALLVKLQTETKYSLLIASETIPAVFGTPSSFEFDLLNSRSLGRVAGKSSVDDKDVEFLLHRDNIYRLEQFRGKVLDFLYFTPDCMAWHFVGQIRVRPNDAGADVLRGTYTVVPMSVDDKPILDARDLIMETALFSDVVPDSLNIDYGNSASTDVLLASNVENATFECKIYDTTNGKVATEESTTFNGTVSGNTLTIAQGESVSTGTHYALAFVTVNADGYASWTTTIALSTTKK